jgi:hypothetical protein
MKTKFFAVAVVICSLNGFSADNTIDVESLKRELKELRQRTDQLEKKIESDLFCVTHARRTCCHYLF